VYGVRNAWRVLRREGIDVGRDLVRFTYGRARRCWLAV